MGGGDARRRRGERHTYRKGAPVLYKFIDESRLKRHDDGFAILGGLVDGRDHDRAHLAVRAVELDELAQIKLACNVAVHDKERLTVVQQVLGEGEGAGGAERLALLR